MAKYTNTIIETNAVSWINVSLIGVALLLLFYYVAIANSVTSKNYKVQVLREKIELLSEENSTLMSQKMLLENPLTLSELAKTRDLVQAGNVSYIFENKDVAQR
jgi:hypothetical protein